MKRIIVEAAKRVLPKRMRATLSRALYPYRQGDRFFTPYIVKGKEMEGETFDLLIGDRTGRDWYDRPCINNPRWLEMRFVRDHMIVKGDVILECGAHHGCSTILLSKWVGPSGQVVAFEPSPVSYKILLENLRLNQLRNVKPDNLAIGSDSGTILFDPQSDAVGVSRHGVEVGVVRLDDYVRVNAPILKTPTFLKIDVEGFELDVLEGAKALLATRPKIALELHADFLPKYGASVEAIFRLIGIEQYQVWIQRRDDVWPELYDSSAIEKRCHLFFLRKTTDS